MLLLPILQFQADLLRCSIYRPKMVETTAAGAAYLAGLATGLWESTDEILQNRQLESVFAPKMPLDRAQDYLKCWHRAVARALRWEE